MLGLNIYIFLCFLIDQDSSFCCRWIICFPAFLVSVNCWGSKILGLRRESHMKLVLVQQTEVCGMQGLCFGSCTQTHLCAPRGLRSCQQLLILFICKSSSFLLYVFLLLLFIYGHFCLFPQTQHLMTAPQVASCYYKTTRRLNFCF